MCDTALEATKDACIPFFLASVLDLELASLNTSTKPGTVQIINLVSNRLQAFHEAETTKGMPTCILAKTFKVRAFLYYYEYETSTAQ
jgi:hypothetical protein